MGSRAKYPLLRNAGGGWRQHHLGPGHHPARARRSSTAVNSAGPDSVGIYNTGQWTLEEYYSMGKLGKGAIGTSTMDSNTRLCMAAAVYGYMSTFGSDGPPGCYDDIENTDCFFLIGTNPAEMHPQVWRRIANARRADSALKLIVVDPRRTADRAQRRPAPAAQARHQRGADERHPAATDRQRLDRQRLHHALHPQLRGARGQGRGLHADLCRRASPGCRSPISRPPRSGSASRPRCGRCSCRACTSRWAPPTRCA